MPPISGCATLALTGMASLLLFIFAGILFASETGRFWGTIPLAAGIGFVALGKRAPGGRWRLAQMIAGFAVVLGTVVGYLVYLIFYLSPPVEY